MLSVSRRMRLTIVMDDAPKKQQDDSGGLLTKDLDHREAELRAKKLELEIMSLSDQLSKRFRRRENAKVLVSGAGVLTAIVGLAALVWSVWQGLEQLSLQRQARSQEQLNIAINQLASNDDSIRFVGVLTLQGFLRKEYDEYHMQVLLSLTNQLAKEPTTLVRKTILDVIKQLDDRAIRQATLDAALRSLVLTSRSVSSNADIRREILLDSYRASSSEELLRGKAVGDAIAALVQKNTHERNLSGIFCFKCDFRNANLPGITFDRAVLSQADFTGAALANASFIEALLEGTKFVSSDLRHANFHGKRPSRGLGPLGISTDIFDPPPEEFYALRWGNGTGPVFNCADLSKADFSDRILFTFMYDKAASRGWPYWESGFVKANLEGADFRQVDIIGVHQGKIEDLPFGGVSAWENPGSLSGSLRAFIQRVEKEGLAVRVRKESALPSLSKNEKTFRIELSQSAALGNSAKDFGYSFRFLEMAFAESNWPKSQLPLAIQQHLGAGAGQQSYAISYPASLFDDKCEPKAPPIK
jgi:uncharacterized protein YjbI with pentapeptide repeats